MTGYIKMIDIWMIFTISYPFMLITLNCLKEVAEERGARKINVESTGVIMCQYIINIIVFFSNIFK